MVKIELKQIRKEKLVKNRWYLGRGRNSNIGLWNGEYFLTIGRVFNEYLIKKEPYYVRNKYISKHSKNEYLHFFDERSLGCFQPFILIDEGKMIEPFGNTGWDKTYGKKLSVKLD